MRHPLSLVSFRRGDWEPQPPLVVALALVYARVAGWRQSYRMPLVLMAPIPLALAGIWPCAPCRARSSAVMAMIGFIAGRAASTMLLRLAAPALCYMFKPGRCGDPDMKPAIEKTL